MKALIDPRVDRVVQIVDGAIEFPVSLPLFWVDAPEQVTTQYTFVNSEFVPPVSPPPPPRTRLPILDAVGTNVEELRDELNGLLTELREEGVIL